MKNINQIKPHPHTRIDPSQLYKKLIQLNEELAKKEDIAEKKILLGRLEKLTKGKELVLENSLSK